jgi:hypothetical protein
MKAYFDESGKQASAKTLSLFRLLMSVNTCKELQRRWFKEAAKGPVIPLPFHMTDCFVGRKQFENFDEEAREKMQRRMISTFKGLDMQAYGATVIRKDYAEVAAQLRSDKGLRDPWYLAFEFGIGAMMKGSAEAGKGHGVTFVFDRQEESFALKAHGLFNELLASPLSFAPRLGTLSFSPKDNVAALQAIDVVAHTVNTRWSERDLNERWQYTLITDLITIRGALFDTAMLQSMAEDIGNP